MPTAKKIAASIEKSSWIRKMFEEGQKRKGQYGEDKVFDFSLGNPNIEPPPKFKKVLNKLVQDSSPNQHAYMPNAGFIETREAVAGYLNNFNKCRVGSNDIVMTVGAGGALNIILKTILNPGEEVIIPSPYFVEYNFYIDNHQGLPKIVPTKDDFSLDLDAIEKAINAKTRAILINYPNNPTGRVYDEKELRGLVDILLNYSKKSGNPIYLISDEPYRKIVYDDIIVPWIFNLYQQSFIATSFSKDLSLPGERIGYAVAHPDMEDKGLIIAGLVFCNRTLGYVNAPAIMQRAISFLMEESVDISFYKRKRDLLMHGLSSAGYKFTKPQGAFYLFPKAPIPDDVAFVADLQEENILTVPGSGFGGQGHFRIAYCVPDKVIKQALPYFKKVIQKYQKYT